MHEKLIPKIFMTGSTTLIIMISTNGSDVHDLLFAKVWKWPNSTRQTPFGLNTNDIPVKLFTKFVLLYMWKNSSKKPKISLLHFTNIPFVDCLTHSSPFFSLITLSTPSFLIGLVTFLHSLFICFTFLISNLVLEASIASRIWVSFVIPQSWWGIC